MNTQAQQVKAVVQLQDKDTPIYCPNPAMSHWSAHPRVFLKLDEHGQVRCPYCGTLYQLEYNPV